MTKEELELKIELIEENIKLIKEIVEVNRKLNGVMISAIVLAFIAILFANIGNTTFDIISVFLISLLTVITYNTLDEIVKEKRDNKLKLKQLEVKLSYYKGLLKYK